MSQGHDALEAQGGHDAHPPGSVPAGLSKNRIEALTDGIYAVAMTLLVIDLKVPDPHRIASHEQLVEALADLLPKLAAWVISFFVLAMFWLSHHRLFQTVRTVDDTLLWRNLFQLALVSLLPFSASMIGEYGATREAHYVYNANMLLLAATSMWQLHHVHRHPEMQAHPMTGARYHAALVRITGLMVAAVAAMALAIVLDRAPYFANYVYLVMWPVGVFSRRVVARGGPPALPTDP